MTNRRLNKSSGGQKSARCVFILLILTGVVGSVLLGPAMSQEERGVVYVASLEGVINPLSASYLARAISQAERANAQALIVQLDTPGGLDSSMREMTKDILSSPVPVVVYVAPSGARSASAGMFITVAAHIAAMAPGTNIGAAHPVALGGGEQDEVMTGKVVEDAAATARSLAAVRNRNAAWVEKAVRQSVSATAEEALKLNVIDVIAPSLSDLLRTIDGRKVKTATSEVVLRVRGARQVDIPMTWLETLLHIITDPNIAYLLLSLGAIGIIAELYNPGTFIPGTVGVISLVLAFVALGSLPFGWAGIGLLVLAVALMVGELYTTGFGALGVGAIVAFVIGSLLLFVPLTPVSPSLPAVRVNPWIIALMTATLIFFLVFVAGKMLQSRKQPIATGIEALVGRQGRTVSQLDPVGRVVVRGEEWSAESTVGPIDAGVTVEIESVSGVVLRVRPVETD